MRVVVDTLPLSSPEILCSSCASKGLSLFVQVLAYVVEKISMVGDHRSVFCLDVGCFWNISY